VAGVKARLGAQIRQCALRHGIISRGFSDIQSFAPPIIITEEQIDEMFERFTLALDDVADLLRSEGVLGA
jgi:4-aminobutyrate--pyruvate transaminase